MAKYIDAEKLKNFLSEINKVCPINDDERHGRHCVIIEIEGFIDSLQQEQPEVELEKEIIRYQREDMDRDTTVGDVARHFFNLCLNARKEILKDENIMTVSGPGFFSPGEIRFINMPIADALKAEYEKGKAEALKDLPRWKKCQEDNPRACVYNCTKREASSLYYNGHTIKLIDLEKLPGFKED